MSVMQATATTGPVTETTPHGSLIVRNLKVFRAGKMKDSRGRQRQWAIEHLDLMVQHFNTLRQSGLFPDVPVRADHSQSVNSVVGYVEGLRREGHFLYADIELTEPAAIEKWNRRTFRARSSEIGAYETNDEAVYWPAYMGLAFVDIGAVEGLYRSSATSDQSPLSTFSAVMDDEGDPVSQQNNPGAQPTPQGGDPTATPPANQPPADPAQQQQPPANTPPAAPQQTPPAQPAQTPPADPSQPNPQQTPPAQPAQQQTPPAQPAPDPNDPAQHGRVLSTQTFRVNGQITSDYGAVQRHIDTLEQFQRDQVDAGRRSYVEQLVKDGKIAATQQENMTNFALGLAHDQWSAFKKNYDEAPALSLFGQHGQQNPAGAGGSQPFTFGGQPTTETPAQMKATLEETLAMHRRTGLTEEQVKKTDTYRRLAQLDPAAYPA